MAHLTTHEKDCMRLYGKPFTYVHQWLDWYVQQYPPPIYLEYHRKFRHTQEALEEQFENWGYYEQQAAKVHIIRDVEQYVLTKPFNQVEPEEIDALFERALEYCHW